ncbi:hypothetical protein JHK85_036615 [Glycine max]|nr:hypothetical protein JHK85_036615 [Glycine max]
MQQQLIRYPKLDDAKLAMYGTRISALYIFIYNIACMKLKGPGIPTTILRCAPDSCVVYIVARDRIISKLADFSSSRSCETSPRNFVSTKVNKADNSAGIGREMSGISSFSTEPKILRNFRFLSISERSYIGLQSSSRRDSFENTTKNEEENPENCGDDIETISLHSFDFIPSAQREQLVMQEEVERLQLELQNTITMYKQVCGELVQAQNEMAELDVLKESIEKQRIVDTLLSNDRRYRKYTMDEIKLATNFFAEDLIIGEGGYGKVYKCNLDHSPVAVKVLHQDAINKKDEFLKEVEILSQLHHPNMVLLFGACPESGFFEMACGLSFLHNSKPEPIVHRDIKPGNVLLDRNYVSKIADIGLAKLLVEVVPDNVTEYRESILAGTLHYMDPEYQRTGTVRPKSDVYAFGVITLQLITGRHARGLIVTVELAQVALKCSALRCRDRPEIDTEVLPVLERFSDAANSSTRMGINSVSVPSQYYCPILQEIMDDPYIAADGFTYEYIAIKAWLSKHNVSPMTKLKLQYSVLTPNHTLRSAIQEWKSGVTF